MDLSKFEGHTPGPWSGAFNLALNWFGGETELRLSPQDRALIAAAPELLEEVTRLRAKVKELLGVMRDVEGVDTGNIRDCYVYRCPVCWVGSNGGEQDHDPDCRLAAALNDARKGEEES